MRRYAEKTTVSESSSRAEIERLLEKCQITEYGIQKQLAAVTIIFRHENIVYKISIHVENDAQDNRRIWRSLVLLVKANLVAINDGITSFQQAFLPYVVMDSGETLFEKLRPSLEQSQKSGAPLALGVRNG